LYDDLLARAHVKERHPEHLQQNVSGRVSMEHLHDQIVHQMHLGNNGNVNFWCGFCNRHIEQSPNTRNAMEQRFKHIGDHFDRYQCIDEWTCVVENKKKRFITKADDKVRLHQRKATTEADEVCDMSESDIADLLTELPEFDVKAFASPSTGHDPGMPAVAVGAYTASHTRRRVEEEEMVGDADADAEGVSDDEMHDVGHFV